MTGALDMELVALSIMIATFSAYASFDLVGRVTTARPGRRAFWLLGGSVTLGVGMWATHYIGMAAYHPPVPVQYNWPTVLLSLMSSVGACWWALYLACRPFMTYKRTAMGSTVMGGGMIIMLYLGMEAMRLPARLVYSPAVVCLAGAISFAISFLSLRLAFTFRHVVVKLGWRKLGSALLVGLAISTMHYVGVASAKFVPAPLSPHRLLHAVSVTGLGLTTIAVSTMLILSIALVTSAVDRQTTLQDRELTRARQQLQTVFDTMSEGILVVIPGGDIVHMNRGAAAMFGVLEGGIDSLRAGEAFDLLHPDGTLMSREDYPSTLALRGELCKNRELIVRRKGDEASVFAAATTVPILNAAGETIQILITLRDITERKEKDAALTLVMSIVDSSPDPIIGFDLGGAVTTWNAGAQETFGYLPAEIVGKSIDLLVPFEREIESDALWEKIREGANVKRFETERKTKDGKLIHVDLTVSPIRDAWGQVVGGSLIARDITTQKQLRQQLHQSQKMDAVGQLTGGIAHDFNNLLGIVIGNLDLAERLMQGNEAAAKRIDVAMRAATRGADLTRRLLTLSSIDELRPSNLPLKHAIRNTLELVSRAIGPEVEITTDFEPELPTVFADPAGFESSLLNLVVNARDAMPKGGSIRITARRFALDAKNTPVLAGELKPGPYVCISVSDTGTGMSPAVQDRAFEPFFSTKQRGRGTGLGLAMVYGFAKQSNGTARLYSEVGHGTTVSLYLPVAVNVAPQRMQPKGLGERLGEGTAVIVVDDELEMLDIANEYLQDLGFTTHKAKDAASALALLRLHPEVVLLITDIMMPGGMNGAELANKAREHNPELKTIFSSGFPAGALAEKSLIRTDELLLNKPYNFQEFSLMVAEVCAAPQLPTAVPY